MKTISFVILLLLLPLFHLAAQTPARLSIGPAVGYAPLLTYGSDQNSGLTYGIFGDLQIKNMIGRLSYTGVAKATVPDKHFESGNLFQGTIGYSFKATDMIYIPVMISGGAAIITYNNGLSNGSGNNFWDANPQVGILLAPYYKLTDKIDLQLNLRYLKGFTVDNRSDEINVGDVNLGVRFSL